MFRIFLSNYLNGGGTYVDWLSDYVVITFSNDITCDC